MTSLPLTLRKSMLSFQRPSGRHLLDRTQPMADWVSQRRADQVWPFTTTLHSQPKPETIVSAVSASPRQGINFASQDYLSLSCHPDVLRAAKEALDKFGPHSAGSAMLQGNTSLSLQLERDLAQHLQTEHVILYPTGWGAGYGVITGLVRPKDVVILDQLAHACLQAGAAAATPNVLRHKHLDVAAVPEMLRKLREDDAHEAGIMVVTEGLFSMDSDIPDIAPLQAACRQYDAVLVVDVAHDLGSMGPNGTGALGLQNLIGKVDLVMGSFSKTFSSNGGFVATHSEGVRDFLRAYSGPHTFSNALSPVQAAIVGECLRIVRSDEGEVRRLRMLSVANLLRNELESKGIQCIGVPSAIVPAMIGNEALARLTVRRMRERGVYANLVEFPAVSVDKARFRLQVMADHEPAQARLAALALSESLLEAKEELKQLKEE